MRTHPLPRRVSKGLDKVSGGRCKSHRGQDREGTGGCVGQRGSMGRGQGASWQSWKAGRERDGRTTWMSTKGSPVDRLSLEMLYEIKNPA